MTKARFYFDYISPYAYLAWKRLPELGRLEIELKPVLFAALLNHWGQLGPAEIAPKRLFTFKDVARRAKRSSIDLGLPFSHPFRPLLPLRVTHAAPLSERARVVERIFTACWAEGKDISDPEVLGAEVGAELVAAASDFKSALRTTTEEAIAEGVFGVPSIGVGCEIFWGDDQWPHIETYLDGNDPAPDFAAGLVALSASAGR